MGAPDFLLPVSDDVSDDTSMRRDNTTRCEQCLRALPRKCGKFKVSKNEMTTQRDDTTPNDAVASVNNVRVSVDSNFGDLMVGRIFSSYTTLPSSNSPTKRHWGGTTRGADEP